MPRFACRLLLLFHVSLAAQSAVTLIGEGAIPADALDQSGATGLLEDGRTPKARVGGLGGAITWSGQGPIYYAVPDRGPGAGETSFQGRLYRLELQLSPQGHGRYSLDPRVLETHLLTDTAGHAMTGDARAFDPLNSPDSLRLDAEAIRLAADGRTAFVSDEYGPFIDLFDIRSGKRLKTLKVPNKFQIDSPSADGREEMRHNLFGRQSNRGFEGLAITPDGKRLLAIIQDPLLQDAEQRADGKATGLNNRMLELDLETGGVREFVYPLEDAANGVSEILAINADEYLVLERDTRSGEAARFKKVFRVSLAGASDVHTVQSLAPGGESQPGWTPVRKTLFLDLLAQGIREVPEKFEGMTFGPPLEDGRQLLIIGSDNDFSSREATRFFAFAIDPGDLPGYQPQRVAAPLGHRLHRPTPAGGHADRPRHN